MIVGNFDIFDQVAHAKKSRQLDLLSRGDYSPLKDELAAAYPRTDLPVRAIPFVERYVAELAGLYAEPVVRRFLPHNLEPDAFKKLQNVYASSKIDRVLDNAEKSLWCQNTVMLLVLPNGLGRVRVQPLLPWQIEAVEVDDPLAAEDPRSWSRVVANVPAGVAAGQVIYGRLELTRSTATRQVGGGTVGLYAEDGSHPFGVVPLIVAHRVAPDPGRWAAPVNEAVLNLQVALSLQQADNENIVRHCAFPQKTIENATVAQQVEEITVGPDKVIALVRSGDPDAPAPRLAVVQGHVPVAELVSFAEHQIRLYASLLGLDPSSFLRVNTAVTASARLFSAQDRQKLRRKVQPVLRQLETELARWVAAVLSLREPMPLPEDLAVEVRWTDTEPSPDPLHDAQAVRERVRVGLDNPIDLVAKKAGLGRSEAKKLVERNIKEGVELGLIEDVGGNPDA